MFGTVIGLDAATAEIFVLSCFLPTPALYFTNKTFVFIHIPFILITSTNKYMSEQMPQSADMNYSLETVIQGFEQITDSVPARMLLLNQTMDMVLAKLAHGDDAQVVEYLGELLATIASALVQLSKLDAIAVE